LERANKLKKVENLFFRPFFFFSGKDFRLKLSIDIQNNRTDSEGGEDGRQGLKNFGF